MIIRATKVNEFLGMTLSLTVNMHASKQRQQKLHDQRERREIIASFFLYLHSNLSLRDSLFRWESFAACLFLFFIFVFQYSIVYMCVCMSQCWEYIIFQKGGRAGVSTTRRRRPAAYSSPHLSHFNVFPSSDKKKKKKTTICYFCFHSTHAN